MIVIKSHRHGYISTSVTYLLVKKYGEEKQVAKMQKLEHHLQTGRLQDGLIASVFVDHVLLLRKKPRRHGTSVDTCRLQYLHLCRSQVRIPPPPMYALSLWYDKWHHMWTFVKPGRRLHTYRERTRIVAIRIITYVVCLRADKLQFTDLEKYERRSTYSYSSTNETELFVSSYTWAILLWRLT